MPNDDATVVLTDIHKALASSDLEAQDQPAALVVVGGDLNGTLFDLIAQEVGAGRSPDNLIPLEFHGISRLHFKIKSLEEGSKHTVEDCGSKNGTFVNNQQLTEAHTLQKGDIIKVGNIAMKYLPKGDPERLTYDKLQHEANTDGHTGCYNKTYFNNALDLEVKKSKLSGNPLSLIVFDLDHFKSLNDNYGHDAGDYVLKDLAAIIRDQGVRDRDIFARYGGEEFVILLPATNLKQAFEIAERLRKLIESYEFIYSEQRLPVTASIGIADYRQGVAIGTDLFKRADKAVYQSKEGGRNQVNFFKPLP
jgi:two-component system cell cycle response regulator